MDNIYLWFLILGANIACLISILIILVWIPTEPIVIKTLNENEAHNKIKQIKKIVKCPILIVGPYLSLSIPDIVNKKRKNILVSTVADKGVMTLMVQIYCSGCMRWVQIPF